MLRSQENTCSRVSFEAATLCKKRLWHCGFLVNFARHLWITASILQQLLQLYIAGNFQVVKCISTEKNSSIYFKDFTDLDFFYTGIFCLIFFHDCLFTLPVTLYFKQPTVLLARRNLNTFLTNF